MNLNSSKANKTNMLLTNTMQNGYTFDHTQLLSQYQHSSKQSSQSNNNKCNKQLISNLSPNRNLQTSNKLLMEDCYIIIQQQQQYIDKLEKDNNRKNAIIQNLLRKSQITKSKNHSNTGLDHQIQQLKSKLQLGACSLQQANNQIQCYQIEVNNKNQQILSLSKHIKFLQKIMQDANKQIEQHQMVVSKLKQTYESKILQLLAQMRKKVQEDVYKSQMKIKSRTDAYGETEKGGYYQDQNPQSSYSFQNNYQRTNNVGKIKKIYNSVENQIESYNRMVTPIKNFNQVTNNQFKLNDTPSIIQKMGERKNYKYFSEEKKNMTEKKINNKQIKVLKTVGTQIKSFSNSQETTQEHESTNFSTKKKQNIYSKNNRMLIGVNDVQFVTDSYSDSYSQQSSIISKNNQNIQKPNNKLISIKQILNNAVEYKISPKKSSKANSQLNDWNLQQTDMYNQTSYQGKNKQITKTKIQHILEDLNKRIEKIERDQVKFQFI